MVGLEDVQELRAAGQHVYVDGVLHRWVVELVRATRDQEAVVIGSSVRGQPGARACRARVGPPQGRGYVIPEDIERLFVPVLVHRVVFTPSFVARARASGWERRSRSSVSAASSSRRAPAPRRIRSSSDPAPCRRSPSLGVRRPAHLYARSAAAGDGALVRDDAESPQRLRLGRRRLAAVSPRRRHGRDRLGSFRPALHGQEQ